MIPKIYDSVKLQLRTMTDALFFEELQWLTDVIVARMKLYFNQESEVKDINQIPPPVINDNS